MGQKNVKILVCCHKHDIVATNPPYLPIHAGKALHPDLDLGMVGDNTGDNISAKNGDYCELTALYWAWKNLSDANVVGLCHYRRYFDFHRQCRAANCSTTFPTKDFGRLDLSVPDKTVESLQPGQAIVARGKYYRYPMWAFFCCSFGPDIARSLKTAVDNLSPEYSDAFRHVMYMSDRMSPFNMFIMTRDDFSAYCSWMFGVLDEVSKSNLNYPRIHGFLGEYLLNVWLRANKIKRIEKPVIWFTDVPYDGFASEHPLMALQRNVRWWLATKLISLR